MAEKKTIWDKISANGAILIFVVTIIFNVGKYTGDTSSELKEVRNEFKEYKEQQQYQRTQDNLFVIEVRNSINKQNIQIATLIEKLEKKNK